MDIYQPRANILIDLNAKQCREVFEESAGMSVAGRDAFLSDRHLSLSLFQWPASKMALLMSAADGFMDDVDITNREMKMIEREDGMVDVRLNATIWTNVGQYVALRHTLLNMLEQQAPQELPMFKAFEKASLSLHYPARHMIIEDGVEVGTRETETMVCLQSAVAVKDGMIAADLSDIHDDEAEQANAGLFTQWFEKGLSAQAVLLPFPRAPRLSSPT